MCLLDEIINSMIMLGLLVKGMKKATKAGINCSKNIWDVFKDSKNNLDDEIE